MRIVQKKFLTLLIVAMFSLVLIGKAAEQNVWDDWKNPKPPSKFLVWVSVSCDDKNTKAFIESHLKRELRSLQDVEMIGILEMYTERERGVYELGVVAVEPIYTTTGQKTGSIGVSWTFLKEFDNKPLISKYTSAVDRGGIQEMTQWLYHFPKNGIMTSSTKDLDALCKDVVVKFDTLMLEPDRKAR